MICLDANSKMGNQYIPNDSHVISENGKILECILNRNALIVANGINKKSSGVITRSRTTKEGEEKSSIDLVILSSDMVTNLKQIIIDEDKVFALESIVKTKKGVVIKKSDHNTILTKFEYKWDNNLKENREEFFNLKNKEGMEKFNKITSGNILTSIVEKNQDANVLTNKFLKRLNGMLHQCFKKTRIKEEDKETDIIKLFDERNKLRSKEDKHSKSRLIEVEQELADKCAENNYKKIMEEIKDIECDEGGFHMGKLWKLKKKLCPFKTDPVTAMLNPKGNLVTSSKNLEKHTLEHYKQVLGNRTIKPDLTNRQRKKSYVKRK